MTVLVVPVIPDFGLLHEPTAYEPFEKLLYVTFVLAPIEIIVEASDEPGSSPLIVETVKVERARPLAVIVDITIVEP
jgi:hypothetical protein